MRVLECRTTDPAIKRVLQHLAAVNIQEPEFSAIKKILEEGADGRYLKDDTQPDEAFKFEVIESNDSVVEPRIYRLGGY